MKVNTDSMMDDTLCRQITKAASKQTYYTIRFLVDRNQIPDAYRAYAYFRWVDDWLDTNAGSKAEKIAFINRQRSLIDCSYLDQTLPDLLDEEQMLVDLIRNNEDANSKLQVYIWNMMAVMTFDAERRGRLVSQQELTNYSHHLAVAVTEAMHHFIGHDDPPPQHESRYLAVTAAHIVHMLRDTVDDLSNGYFNIPREWIESYDLDPCAFESDPYRKWVKNRVQLARSYFRAGRNYLDQVNMRCRIAGYAYMARFEHVLDMIEMDGYRLRSDYHDGNSLASGLRMCSAVIARSLGLTHLQVVRGES